MRLNSRQLLGAACLAIALAGCASAPPRGAQSSVPDYAGWSCGELAKEAARLVRRTTGTQEFLLPQGRKHAREQRERDKAQLKAAKQAALSRGC